MTRARDWTRRLGGLCAVMLGLSACRTPLPLPRIDLAEPGWTILRGQAVWEPRKTAPGIAGDLLLATRPDGRLFVQFSKSPITLAVAEKAPTSWQVEFPLQNRRYAGPGAPPDRLIWFLLPKALSGAALPQPWTWRRLASGNWRLLNPKTGESLEGFLDS